MGFAADVEAMLAGLPNAVTVRFGSACARGPLDVAAAERSDGSGGTVRGAAHVLSIPANKLPKATTGSLLTCTDEDDTVTSWRVHDRYPAVGDRLVHELLLVEVS